MRIAPAGHRGPQPGLRRHPGRAHHRDRHRGGRRPRAVRGRPARRGRRRPAARWAAGRRLAAPRPVDRGRPGPALMGSLMATVAVGRREAIVARRDDGPRRCCARSSSRTGCTPPTRSATSRSASSRRTRWGLAWDGDAPIALVLEYNGPTPQPLFVMGRAGRDRGRPARPHPAARSPTSPRRPRCCPRSRPPTAWTPVRRWSGCGSTGRGSGRTRRRSSACCRSRSAT